MKLRSPKPRYLKVFKRLKRYVKNRILLCVLILVTFMVGIVLGSKITRNGLTLGHIANQTSAVARAIVGFVQGQFVQTDKLVIDLDHQDYQTLSYFREQALETGELNTDSQAYVNGTIKLKDNIYNVDIRLKGDRAVHYSDPHRWSFRVEVDDDKSIKGLRVFSLHKPGMRNYINEWVFHKILEREGLLNLRYHFVDVVLNGRNLGTYAMEEHFDKVLVESRQYREGPIVRFSEDAGTELYTSPIDPFQNSRWEQPENKAIAQQAISLLEGFRRGEYTVSEVFDVQQLAQFLAITDLLETHHAAISKSLRFYYNPITSRLTPIGFDGHAGVEDDIFISAELGINPRGDFLYNDFGEFFRLLFNSESTFDEQFYKKYIQELQRLSEKKYLDEFFSEYQQQISAYQNLIYKDLLPRKDNVYWFGPDFYQFNKQLYYQRQNYIRSILSPQVAVQGFVKQLDNQSIVIDIANTAKIPVLVTGVEIESQTFPLSEPIRLLAGDRNQPLSFITVTFPVSLEELANDSEKAIKIIHNPLAIDNQLLATAYHFSVSHSLDDNSDLLRQPANIRDFSGFSIDELTKTIRTTEQNLTLTKTLIIPPGYNFEVLPGTSLNLANNALIISYSPVKLLGTENQPITISSVDKTGQGLVVLEAPETSIIKNTTFSNLAFPQTSSWELTGAVTFYESDVDISNTTFVSNQAEDSLNIFRAKFSITNSDFINSTSDAFDGDFVTGVVSNSTFTNITNDAIDVSGSNLELKEIYISQAGDKGISSGESSQVFGSDITIKNSNIGVASKDISFVSLEKIIVSDSQIGLAAYQKKPEYGPSTLLVNDANIQAVDTQSLQEVGSRIVVNYVPVTKNTSNVAAQLYDE